jgi:hypothetical protein
METLASRPGSGDKFPPEGSSNAATFGHAWSEPYPGGVTSTAALLCPGAGDQMRTRTGHGVIAVCHGRAVDDLGDDRIIGADSHERAEKLRLRHP